VAKPKPVPAKPIVPTTPAGGVRSTSADSGQERKAQEAICTALDTVEPHLDSLLPLNKHTVKTLNAILSITGVKAERDDGKKGAATKSDKVRALEGVVTVEALKARVSALRATIVA